MEMGTIFWNTQNENGNYILRWKEYYLTHFKYFYLWHQDHFISLILFLLLVIEKVNWDDFPSHLMFIMNPRQYVMRHVFLSFSYYLCVIPFEQDKKKLQHEFTLKFILIASFILSFFHIILIEIKSTYKLITKLFHYLAKFRTRHTTKLCIELQICHQF